MADLEHLEQLKKGTRNWNEWRRDERAAAGRMNLYLNLIEADLTRATLDFGNFSDVDFLHANFQEATARKADFRATILTNCNLNGTDFSESRLHQADLRGSDMKGTRFKKTALNGVRVTTVFDENSNKQPIITDLSNCIDLTQKQLNSMVGDRLTVIPANLVHPPQWLDKETPPLESSVSSNASPGQLTASRIKESVLSNKDTIGITGSILLIHLDEFIQNVRGKNSLENDAKQELLLFLNQHRSNVDSLISSLPDEPSEITDNDVEAIEPLLDGYLNHMKKMFKLIIEPEQLSETTVILASTALGTAFGSPLTGLGIGMWITRKTTSGKLLENLMKNDNSNSKDVSDGKE